MTARQLALAEAKACLSPIGLVSRQLEYGFAAADRHSVYLATAAHWPALLGHGVSAACLAARPGLAVALRHLAHNDCWHYGEYSPQRNEHPQTQQPLASPGAHLRAIAIGGSSGARARLGSSGHAPRRSAERLPKANHREFPDDCSSGGGALRNSGFEVRETRTRLACDAHRGGPQPPFARKKHRENGSISINHTGGSASADSRRRASPGLRYSCSTQSCFTAFAPRSGHSQRAEWSLATALCQPRDRRGGHTDSRADHHRGCRAVEPPGIPLATPRAGGGAGSGTGRLLPNVSSLWGTHASMCAKPAPGLLAMLL